MKASPTAHALAFMLFATQALAQAATPTATPATTAAPTVRVNQAISPFRSLPLSNQYIQKMICPSAFVGILVTIWFLFLCLLAAYQLMSIQTPLFYHHENKEQRWAKVNWGKVDHDS